MPDDAKLSNNAKLVLAVAGAVLAAVVLLWLLFAVLTPSMQHLPGMDHGAGATVPGVWA
jgi:hypothetical protein